MRQFECADLGHDCSWKHAATEELLMDMTALHLRDVHGIYSLDTAMIGRIKNLFSLSEESEEAAAVEPVMKEYSCDLAPGCSWRYFAMTEDLIADGAAVHGREVHGIGEFSPEMIAHVKKSIHLWTGPAVSAAGEGARKAA